MPTDVYPNCSSCCGGGVDCDVCPDAPLQYQITGEGIDVTVTYDPDHSQGSCIWVGETTFGTCDNSVVTLNVSDAIIIFDPPGGGGDAASYVMSGLEFNCDGETSFGASAGTETGTCGDLGVDIPHALTCTPVDPDA